MLIQTLLDAVHLRFEKNIDYPVAGEEDFLVRLGYANDGINMWEKEAKEGVLWKPLKKSFSWPAAGTGTDPLPTDFLAFIRQEELPVVISDGVSEWQEVSMADGNRLAFETNNSEHVFWIEAGNIRTLPAISGTISFPYIKKATRYTTGSETTPIDIEDDMFLQEYVLAQLYLDDDNLTQYQAHMNNAKDILLTMKYDTIGQKPSDSGWGFGM